MTYDVVLKDADGFDICTDLIEGLTAAKARAKYLLSEDHANVIGSTRLDLGVHKVEVQATRTGAVVWDAFL